MSSTSEYRYVDIPFTNIRIKYVVLITYVLVSMYSTSFFLQIALFSYITKGLDIDPVRYGYLQTVFGAVQLIGGPIFGVLSDRHGVRMAVRLSHLSCALYAMLLFVAVDFWTLLLSRAVCVFMHGLQAAQTTIAIVTEEGQERTNAFSRMGVAFASGFMLGPLLSGLLSSMFGYKAPLLASAGISLFSGLVLADYIPASVVKVGANHETPTADAGSAVWDSLKIWRSFTVFRHRGVARLFVIKNLAVTPLVLVTSILQLYLMERFALAPDQNAFVSVYVGVCILFMNAFGVVWLRARLDERLLLRLGAGVLVLTYAGFAVFWRLWHLLLLTPGLALGMTMIGTVVDSRVTALVPQQENGVALGLSNSLNALSRTVAPTLAGLVLKELGFAWFGYFGVLSCTLALLVMWLDGDVQATKPKGD